MNKSITFGIAALVVAIGIGSLTQAQAGGPKHVGPWDAIKAAEAKEGGKAFSATYISEGGKYIYDVIVIKGKKITEVEVDAATGKVGNSEDATPEGEGKELTSALNVAIGKAKAVPEKDEKGEKDEKDEKPVKVKRGK